MKFVIAPDKYKGSLTGSEFCNVVAKAIKQVIPQSKIVKIPLADGGDGTLEAIKDCENLKTYYDKVSDPLGTPIEAPYLYNAQTHTAFIEMAAASGLHLLKPRQFNCMHSTTLGTGQLLLEAIKKGAKIIYLGIGGSATNDGGIGVAHALGYKFLDQFGQTLEPVGANLQYIKKIVPPQKKWLAGVTVKVACDVQNPFYGRQGAAFTFAAQKGANKEEIEHLDLGLKNLRNLVMQTQNIDLQLLPGSGAAGGLGGGAVAFLNAQLTSGINLVMHLTNFEQACKGAHWIITGEGKLDSQTQTGKTISGVTKIAKKLNIPVAAFCGNLNLSIAKQQQLGLTYAAAIVNNITSLEMALKNTKNNLYATAFNFAQLIKASC